MAVYERIYQTHDRIHRCCCVVRRESLYVIKYAVALDLTHKCELVSTAKPPHRKTLEEQIQGRKGKVMADSQGNTGTQDVHYNIISILYHALQAAETTDQYIQDAEQSGNQDLTQFFRDVKEENKRRADRAKQLLGQLLGQGQQQSQSQTGGR